MSAFMLIELAVLLFVAAAVLAFLFSFHRGLSGLLAGAGGAVACGMVVVVAAGLLTGKTASGEYAAIWLHQLIRLTPLNAVWLLAIALPGLFISLYNVAWHRHAQVKANGLLVNLLMAAAVCTIVASDLLTLVVMAEIMALCGAFLTGCAQSGKLWFTLGRIGTLLLAAACWLVWQRYGTLEISTLAVRFADEGPGTAIGVST